MQQTLREYIADHQLDPDISGPGDDWKQWADLRLDLPVHSLGTVQDGINRSEIIECDGGIILCNYQARSVMYDDRAAWIDSLADFDKPEALALLAKSEAA